MPIFEYRCEGCGEILEALVRGSDVEPSSCAACGGKLSRLVSLPADLKRLGGFFHKEKFSDAEIASKGLTKYVTRGDGTYETAAGSAPSIIDRHKLPG